MPKIKGFSRRRVSVLHPDGWREDRLGETALVRTDTVVRRGVEHKYDVRYDIRWGGKQQRMWCRKAGTDEWELVEEVFPFGRRTVHATRVHHQAVARSPEMVRRGPGGRGPGPSGVRN